MRDFTLGGKLSLMVIVLQNEIGPLVVKSWTRLFEFHFVLMPMWKSMNPSFLNTSYG